MNDFGIQSIVKKEKGHGRIETRTYRMTDKIDWIVDDRYLDKLISSVFQA
ncbi:MAG: hypothetical protein LBS91_04910 [Clostridiales Family XIII bacterium]|nr:hypothetical protein [Clostridiales Family XIII bacterium]